MTPETIDAIKNSLAPVADKIGQGAEYSWDVLVWGQFAEGVGMLLIGSLTTLTILTLWVIAYKKHEMVMEVSDGGIYFGLVMLSVFLLPLAAGGIYSGLISVIAPEYAALKFLLTLVQ